MLKYFRYFFFYFDSCFVGSEYFKVKYQNLFSDILTLHVDNCWKNIDNTLKMSDKDHGFTDFNMFNTLEVSQKYIFDILFLFFKKLLGNCKLVCEKIKK